MNVVMSSEDNILTDTEMMVLGEFLLLPEKYKYQRFSKAGKSKVVDNCKKYLGWETTKVNLNNKIYGLISKGYVRRDADHVLYIVKPLEQAANYLINHLDKAKIVITFEDNKGSVADNQTDEGTS